MCLYSTLSFCALYSTMCVCVCVCVWESALCWAVQFHWSLVCGLSCMFAHHRYPPQQCSAISECVDTVLTSLLLTSSSSSSSSLSLFSSFSFFCTLSFILYTILSSLPPHLLLLLLLLLLLFSFSSLSSCSLTKDTFVAFLLNDEIHTYEEVQLLSVYMYTCTCTHNVHCALLLLWSGYKLYTTCKIKHFYVTGMDAMSSLLCVCCWIVYRQGYSLS